MVESAKVLVDTSVWVDFFRGKAGIVAGLSLLARSGRVIVCGQVKQEVLQGSRDDKAFARLEQEMELWEYEAEQPEDFVEAARIFARLRWKGVTVPPTNCLIAAVAMRRELLLYTIDEDFQRVAGLHFFDPTALSSSTRKK